MKKIKSRKRKEAYFVKRTFIASAFANNIDSDQPVQSAQADLNRNFLPLI